MRSMCGCGMDPRLRRREVIAFRWIAVGISLALMAVAARASSCPKMIQNFARSGFGVVESWYSWATHVSLLVVGFAPVVVVRGSVQPERARGAS